MDELGLHPAPGEVIIEHPEVEGAIQRIAAEHYNPAVHKAWDLSVAPWRDGTGNLLPGAVAPEREAPKARKRKTAEPDEA